MPLPGVASPKRKERVIHGVSNRGSSPRHHASVRLCQLPNARATVDERFMKNIDNQRYIHDAMRESRAVHAPDHHSYAVPPPLPSAGSLLQTMRSEPPEVRALAPASPPRGMAGLLGQEASERLRPPEALYSASQTVNPTPRRTRTAERSPRSSSAHATSDEVRAATSPRNLVATAGAEARPTAAQRFLQGDLYSKPSVLPSMLPAAPPVNPRSGATYRPDTLPLTQASPGTGSYAPPETRFDANTRGLNIARVAQEAKLRDQVAKEVKTAVRREKERAVVESRLADGMRSLRVEEGRILSKARQRADYQQRMSTYKFTK